MPTTARLVSAIALIMVGLFIAFVTAPLFEEGRLPGFWYPICIGTGIWTGWVVMGKRLGQGYAAAIGHSTTGIVTQVFWIVVILAMSDMLEKSMRRSYDGPIEALIDAAQIGISYGSQLFSINLVMGLGIAVVLVAVFTEFFARRFS